MKIHDLLLSVLNPGELLSYKEIKKRVLEVYPTLKPSSIIPSEHVDNPQGRCKRCQDQAIFERVGHGIYKVLPQRSESTELPMHDKLRHSLLPFAGECLKVEHIRQAVVQHFPKTHSPSILPGDHVAGGACRICADQPLLERSQQRGWYRVLPEAFVIAGSNNTTAILRRLLTNYAQEQLPLVLQQIEHDLQHQNHLPFRESHLLRHALKTGIVTELIKYGDTTEKKELHLAQKLYDLCGISLPLGLWTVKAWTKALQQTFHTHLHYPDGLHGLQIADPATPAYTLKEPLFTVRNDGQKTQGIFWQSHPIGKILPAQPGYWLGVRKRYFQPALKTRLPPSINTWPANQRKPHRFKLFTWFYCQNQAELQNYLQVLKKFYESIN